MSDREHPSLSVSIADPTLRAFARDQAGRFFGGRLAAYFAFLLEVDRGQGITRDEITRRLAEPIEERELAEMAS